MPASRPKENYTKPRRSDWAKKSALIILALNQRNTTWRSRLRRRPGHRHATGMCWCQATMWTGNYGRGPYIKEDGTKRFAKDSRKHGCFHVVGTPNSAAAIQKIAMSPVVVSPKATQRQRSSRSTKKCDPIRLRRRESSCGRDIHPRALARQSDRHRWR